jgi:ribose/xylose/arabinose/galactoside ABC-type transport system permease subunit
LTGTASAALLRVGWNAWVVMLLMLVMGVFIGSIMGSLVTFLKVQPFIATLAFLWIRRGLCFVISDDSIPINNPTYELLKQTKILIPGLSDPVTKTGPYIFLLVVLVLVVYALAIYILHYTRFGRTVYAIGGSEQSARLMGLRVNVTRVGVYALAGFFSALAGITHSIYIGSGHGLYVEGLELMVIASVVMGGTMLTGGVGYILGTMFGVLLLIVTQTLVQATGELSSWLTNIVVGALTLVFIGVQSLLALHRQRKGGARKGGVFLALRRNRKTLIHVSVTLSLIVLTMLGFSFLFSGTTTSPCQAKPFRQELAASLMKDGAVITYERNGGPTCIDELYAIYPDGKIKGDEGDRKVEKQVAPEEVSALLEGIDKLGWFTEELYSTWHIPCGQCYTYFITLSYQGREKTVKAVDGGTDAPSQY